MFSNPLDWLPLGVGAGLGGLVMLGLAAGYDGIFDDPAVRAETRAIVAAEARERAFDLIRQRSKDNAEISTFDQSRLCAELGGKWVQPDNRCD